MLLHPFLKNPVIASFFREIGRVDELGSGLRNTNKYLKIYAYGQVPEFIEGDVFKIFTPIQNILNVGVNVGVNVLEEIIGDAIAITSKSVTRKLALLLKAIIIEEGLRTPDYHSATRLGSERTIERYLQQLKIAKLIEFIGDSPKTGGYFVTENIKEKIG